jgi:hypothetical protein
VTEHAPDELAVRSVCPMWAPAANSGCMNGDGNVPVTPIFEGSVLFPVKFGYQWVCVVEQARAQTGVGRRAGVPPIPPSVGLQPSRPTRLLTVPMR